MGKLNQVIAVLQGKKTQAEKSLTEVYQSLQKAGLLDGISRTYRPRDDDGERLPAESKGVQATVDGFIDSMREAVRDWYDVTATQEWANTQANADVAVNGTAILTGVPVSVLLFLEKRLVDLHTFVSKLPTLDPAEQWSKDQTTDAYRTAVHETTRTKKVPRNHVVAEATKEHPAQVQVYTEDVTVGYWDTVKFSGAIPVSRKNEMLSRVRALQDAVKRAREQANSIDVIEKRIGDSVLSFIFG